MCTQIMYLCKVFMYELYILRYIFNLINLQHITYTIYFTKKPCLLKIKILRNMFFYILKLYIDDDIYILNDTNPMVVTLCYIQHYIFNSHSIPRSSFPPIAST
jgi:hypothetical protein